VLDVVDAFLEQVGTPRCACVEECQCVARLRIVAEHDDAQVRMRLPELLRGPDPSSTPPGGMRMSVITTSGCSSSTAARSAPRSPQAATISTSSCVSSKRRIPSRSEVVVFCEHETDRTKENTTAG